MLVFLARIYELLIFHKLGMAANLDVCGRDLLFYSR
jgi:hypothetical protein